tara:strand:- start:984 stop:1463 length:480 start_codon:yes stop_codon:yes gene_type:complete
MTTKNNIKEINPKSKVTEDNLLSSVSTLALWFEQNYINSMAYDQEWKKESEYKRFVRTLCGVCESLIYQKQKYINDKINPILRDYKQNGVDENSSYDCQKKLSIKSQVENDEVPMLETLQETFKSVYKMETGDNYNMSKVELKKDTLDELNQILTNTNI